MRYSDRSLSGLQFHFIGLDEDNRIFTPLNRSFTVIRFTKLIQTDEVLDGTYVSVPIQRPSVRKCFILLIFFELLSVFYGSY